MSHIRSWNGSLLVLDPVVDQQLFDEQASFRRGRRTTHQVLKLTNDIEESFEKRNKAGLVWLTSRRPTTHHGITSRAPGISWIACLGLQDNMLPCAQVS